jgi:hypothetical protein
MNSPEKVKIPLQRSRRKHILPAGIHSPKECRFRTGARMRKFALTAVASAILCSGSLLSDRAEAMALGGTAAGVRVAVQDISSVSEVRRYYRRYGYRGYGGGYDGGVVPWDIAPWYWPNEPAPYYVRGETGVRYGRWCWRETDGSRPYGYYRTCPTPGR